MSGNPLGGPKAGIARRRVPRLLHRGFGYQFGPPVKPRGGRAKERSVGHGRRVAASLPEISGTARVIRCLQRGVAIVRGMRIPLDTTPTAARAQEEAYRRVGEGGRFRAALELSDLAHSFAIAGLRARIPGISEGEASQALAMLLYGKH